MSDYSKVASDSMKQLTEKVIKADLASRKIRNLNTIARRYPGYLWLPIIAYVFYHTINYRGRLKSVNAQAGDPLNIWRMLFAAQIAPLREIMRPEIYYQERFFKLKNLSKKVEEEVAKDKNVSFKPYVWH